MRHRRIPTSGTVETYVTLKDDTEVNIIAGWESSPAEPDVNWAGDFDVWIERPSCRYRTSLELDISRDEWEALVRRVQEQVESENDPDNYGDHLYDESRDK